VVAFALAVPALAVAVSPFVDVVPGKFYEAPVNWAFGNGITTGTDAAHFNPEGAVTRGESVTFLKRYDDNIVQPAITGLGQTVGTLSCANNQVAKFDGTNWACGTAIPNTDALAALGCTTNQVARWDGTAWVCNTIELASNLGFDHITSVDSLAAVGLFTSIAIGGDGLPIISYYDFTNGDLKVFHCGEPMCTGGTTSAHDTAKNVGEYTSIAIGTDGFPIISYYDFTNADLKVFHCTDAPCTAGVASLLDATGTVGQYTSIAIGTDGFPIISYYDGTNSDLKVFHCTDAPCTAGVASLLDATGTVGQYTSIIIGADGFPVISYYDGTNGDLKVVHCTNTACTTNDNSITVDATNTVGQYTSIIIGTDGFPIISYYDGTNSNLKVVHCTNTACTTNDSGITVDATGSGSQYSSIAIGADGLPIVSYYDGTNSDLKVVHLNRTVTGIAFG